MLVVSTRLLVASPPLSVTRVAPCASTQPDRVCPPVQGECPLDETHLNCAQCQISFTMMYTSECVACNAPFELDKTTKLCGCPIGYETFTDPASQQTTWCAACCVLHVLLPGRCQPPRQPCLARQSWPSCASWLAVTPCADFFVCGAQHSADLLRGQPAATPDYSLGMRKVLCCTFFAWAGALCAV